MAFFVAIRQEAWPHRLDELLETIRANLAQSRTLHPGRRSARVFQRIGQPTHLLSLGIWEDEAAFEGFRRSPTFAEAATCGPPPRIDPLDLLRRFERMEHRAGVVACAWVSAHPDRAAEVEAQLLSDAHRAVENAPGLVCREVYRVRSSAGQLLIAHSWRSLADLEHFRATDSLRGESTLQRLGAMTDRFTGLIAAEFSPY